MDVWKRPTFPYGTCVCIVHVCGCESLASQREYTHTFTIKIYIPEWELNYTLDVFFERGMVLIQCLCLKGWKFSFSIFVFVNYVKLNYKNMHFLEHQLGSFSGIEGTSVSKMVGSVNIKFSLRVY